MVCSIFCARAVIPPIVDEVCRPCSLNESDCSASLPILLLGRGGLALDGGHQLRNVAGRVRGAVGQFANLVGDHGKAAAGLAGASSFDRGVERQQVGLVGDFLDQVHDAADLLSAALQAKDLAQSVARLLGELVQLAADRPYRVASCSTPGRPRRPSPPARRAAGARERRGSPATQPATDDTSGRTANRRCRSRSWPSAVADREIALRESRVHRRQLITQPDVLGRKRVDASLQAADLLPTPENHPHLPFLDRADRCRGEAKPSAKSDGAKDTQSSAKMFKFARFPAQKMRPTAPLDQGDEHDSPGGADQGGARRSRPHGPVVRGVKHPVTSGYEPIWLLLR
jgi:hypothetical protein